MKNGSPRMTVGRNANWFNHCGNTMEVSQKPQIELPYDPEKERLTIGEGWKKHTFIET